MISAAVTESDKFLSFSNLHLPWSTLASCHILIIGAAGPCCISLLVVLFPADENITQGTSCYAGETLLKQCCKWS